MLELYHNDMSTCAQKVRLTLAEKGLEWEGHHLNLRRGETRTAEYKKLNPNGVVPTLMVEGEPLIESTVIMEYLDDAYPNPPLRPADPLLRAHLRLWTKQLDEGLHAATATISNAIAFRYQWMEGRTDAEMAALMEAIPDPVRRERSWDVNRNGVESHYFVPAILRFDELFTNMEYRLAQSPWLAGETYSLADIAYTPYLTRFEHLQCLGVLDARPRLAEWFERIKARPSYGTAITDWLNDAYLPLMKEKGGEVWPRIVAILAAA